MQQISTGHDLASGFVANGRKALMKTFAPTITSVTVSGVLLSSPDTVTRWGRSRSPAPPPEEAAARGSMSRGTKTSKSSVRWQCAIFGLWSESKKAVAANSPLLLPGSVSLSLKFRERSDTRAVSINPDTFKALAYHSKQSSPACVSLDCLFCLRWSPVFHTRP